MSKREVLEKKYIELRHRVSGIINLNLFPSVDELEVTDIVVLIQMYFDNSNRERVKENLVSLAHSQSIELRPFQVERLVPLIIEFLLFLEKCS